MGRVNIIFGRRRIGKTALVKHFLAGKDAIYLMAINKPLPFNLRRFSEEFSKIYKIPGLNFTNFRPKGTGLSPKSFCVSCAFLWLFFLFSFVPSCLRG